MQGYEFLISGWQTAVKAYSNPIGQPWLMKPGNRQHNVGSSQLQAFVHNLKLYEKRRVFI